MSRFFDSLDRKRLTVISCSNPEHRKIIHQYLESQDEYIYNEGIHNGLSSEDLVYKNCWKGHSVLLKKDTDHDNRSWKDVYRGECSKCRDDVWHDSWEDKKKEYVRFVPAHNAILIMDLKGTSKRTRKDQKKVSEEELKEILEKCTIDVFDYPENRSKKNIIDYVQKEMKRIQKPYVLTEQDKEFVKRILEIMKEGQNL